MKNPFVKDSNTGGWLTASIAGAVAAGTGIWFYLRNRRIAAQEAYRHEHAQDYLKERNHPKQKQTTDVHDLGDLVHHAQV